MELVEFKAKVKLASDEYAEKVSLLSEVYAKSKFKHKVGELISDNGDDLFKISKQLIYPDVNEPVCAYECFAVGEQPYIEKIILQNNIVHSK